ncbi:unknown [Prevotella sp. CAG:1124]|nr:unknown [Prevotella sp. CAG:1124]
MPMLIVLATTTLGRWRSHRRPLTRLPATMPKPAAIIKAGSTSAAKPPSVVSKGLM